MPQGIVGPAGVSSTTPAAVELYTKIIKIVYTDTTRFEGFVLPKGAFIAGAYVIGDQNQSAQTTATITVGVGASGTELVNAYNVKTAGAGYNPVGSAAGSYMGTQLAADTLFKAVYAETGTASSSGTFYVKVEYYMPRSGLAY